MPRDQTRPGNMAESPYDINWNLGHSFDLYLNLSHFGLDTDLRLVLGAMVFAVCGTTSPILY